MPCQDLGTKKHFFGYTNKTNHKWDQTTCSHIQTMFQSRYTVLQKRCIDVAMVIPWCKYGVHTVFINYKLESFCYKC